MKMRRRPTHPGVFFNEEILLERGISVTSAAKSMRLSRKSLSNFINGHTNCSHSMARRLADATGTGVAFWINLQAKVDTWEAEHVELAEKVEPLVACGG